MAIWDYAQSMTPVVILLSLRVGAALSSSPLLTSIAMPRSAKVIFLLVFSICFASLIPAGKIPTVDVGNFNVFISLAAAEIGLGAALGLGVQLAFAAFRFAGTLLDVQLGFGIVQIFDPLSNTKTSILGVAFDQLAVVLFFALGIHYILLYGLAWSVERYPVAQHWPAQQAAVFLIKQAAAIFTLGFALAAPVVFCVLLVEMALGVIAHSLPQMNMLVLGMPVKIVTALLALIFWMPEASAAISRIFGSISSIWFNLLAIGSHQPVHIASLGQVVR